ncbi:MAG: acylneuraminate cytidylyltransferase family protein, partial [Lachnospiraceae bacterium]|nr:acylneuraminate cytidylyltransferase family protein [Lachnospiraceae bacterium]
MNVAFIPVRGGSKSIPLKNIKEIHGKPLVYWTVAAASDCAAIDKVFVATDSAKIKKTVEKFCAKEPERFKRVSVIDRSEESATDNASTESAMIEFAKAHRFDNIVLIQATSPLLTGADLDNGFNIFSSNGTDSVLSVVPQKRFIWEIDDEGNACAKNYDVYNRPRRQEFDEYY